MVDPNEVAPTHHPHWTFCAGRGESNRRRPSDQPPCPSISMTAPGAWLRNVCTVAFNESGTDRSPFTASTRLARGGGLWTRELTSMDRATRRTAREGESADSVACGAQKWHRGRAPHPARRGHPGGAPTALSTVDGCRATFGRFRRPLIRVHRTEQCIQDQEIDEHHAEHGNWNPNTQKKLSSNEIDAAMTPTSEPTAYERRSQCQHKTRRCPRSERSSPRFRDCRS